MPTVPQRYRRTDRRTDGRVTIATPRFAIRTSRGKTYEKSKSEFKMSNLILFCLRNYKTQFCSLKAIQIHDMCNIHLLRRCLYDFTVL